MRLKYLGEGSVSRRRIGRTVVAMALVVTMVPPRIAAASNAPVSSDQAAAEILRVQAKADKTAQRWSEAQSRQQDVAAQIQTSQAEIAAASAQYSDLQTALGRIAIDRFTGGAAPSILLVTGDVTETMQMNVLKNIALDVGATDLDTLDAARSDLDVRQAHLDALQAQSVQLVADLAARQAEIDAQLSDLATVREQLKNDEVKRAYEAQLAKQKQDEAKAAADREVLAAAELAVTAADASAAVAVAPIPARGGGVKPIPPASLPPAPTPSRSSQPTPSTEPPATDPAPDPAPESAPAPEPVISGGSWICPVAGPSAFGDTFGAPRPGGRKHEGVDMMSPYGTPLVAVVSGFANMRTTNLGGNSISLAGDDGNRYFYAHLSSWEGPSRGVAAGEVIGYVGHTGDTTANHLHFEIHPGGGSAVDPYPTVRQYC
ncbi:MAG: peptidoglycan DD-metalloendopeptidase family protein [Ilumatobacteraceae bacterium]